MPRRQRLLVAIARLCKPSAPTPTRPLLHPLPHPLLPLCTALPLFLPLAPVRCSVACVWTCLCCPCPPRLASLVSGRRRFTVSRPAIIQTRPAPASELSACLRNRRQKISSPWPPQLQKYHRSPPPARPLCSLRCHRSPGSSPDLSLTASCCRLLHLVLRLRLKRPTWRSAHCPSRRVNLPTNFVNSTSTIASLRATFFPSHLSVAPSLPTAHRSTFAPSRLPLRRRLSTSTPAHPLSGRAQHRPFPSAPGHLTTLDPFGPTRLRKASRPIDPQPSGCPTHCQRLRSSNDSVPAATHWLRLPTPHP